MFNIKCVSVYVYMWLSVAVPGNTSETANHKSIHKLRKKKICLVFCRERKTNKMVVDLMQQIGFFLFALC